MNKNNIPIRPLSWAKRHVVKKGKQPYKVPTGLFRGLILQLDLQNETQIYLGLWEHETHKFIRTAARTCAWVIDVGAGKGELCLYFLRNSQAERILAFEPQIAESGIILRNLSLNGEQSNQRIAIANDFVGTLIDSTHVSLDSLDVDKDSFGFIKVDVDGYEVDVLKSGERLFGHGNVGLLLETHSKELEEECVDWLECRGYVVEVIKNAWWRFAIPEQRPISHNRWLWAEKRLWGPENLH